MAARDSPRYCASMFTDKSAAGALTGGACGIMTAGEGTGGTVGWNRTP